jgi:hypothetical protein
MGKRIDSPSGIRCNIAIGLHGLEGKMAGEREQFSPLNQENDYDSERNQKQSSSRNRNRSLNLTLLPQLLISPSALSA